MGGRSRIVAVALAGVLAVGGAACGWSADDPPAEGPVAEATGTEEQLPSEEPTAGSSPDVCALLTADDVRRVTKLPIKGAPQELGCTWWAGDRHVVGFSAQRDGGALRNARDLPDVDGLGVPAKWNEKNRQLWFVKDGFLVWVTGYQPEIDRATASELGKLMLTRWK